MPVLNPRPLTPRPLNRRTLLRATGLSAVALPLLAACGGEDTVGGDGGSGPQDIAIQLSWLKNHEFAGYFEADAKGYFTDAGFGTVEMLAGGMGGASAATSLSAGNAWVGIASPSDIAGSNAEGTDLRIVATTYQKNPFTLVSADSAPIPDPAALVGRTIAIADSSATNWEAFLVANDIDPTSVNRVPYGDANNDLRLGNIDGFMGYLDGGAPLRASGFAASEFLLADHGLSYAGEAVVVQAADLADQRDRVKAFLTAYARGWKAAFEDPAGSLDLVVDEYGKDQNWDRAELELSWPMQEALVLTEESRANGIGTISDEALQRNIDSLALTGYDVAAADLFDATLVAEVYEENPELVIGSGQ